MINRVLSILLGVLSLAVLILLAHNWYLSRSMTRTVRLINGEPPLDYGDRVNQRALQTALALGGYRDQLESHKFLLLYFLPSDFRQLQTIKYGEILVQRHGNDGLQALVVTNAKADAIHDLITKESLKLPVLLDEHTLLKLLLRVPDHYQHTYLLTSAGEVVFTMTGAPQEDIVRQIVEKYVAGKIDYDTNQTEGPYRIGDELSRMSVIHVTGGPPRDLLLHGLEVVLIPARCTACRLRGFIDRYRELVTSNRASKPRILVFSQRFPQMELVEDLTKADFPLENVYIARQTLGDFDNEYGTKNRESIMIGIDRTGRIETVTTPGARD